MTEECERLTHSQFTLASLRLVQVRVYCLIARTEPKSIVYFHEGYVRLSIENFTLAEDKLENNFIHLTNAAIQKNPTSRCNSQR